MVKFELVHSSPTRSTPPPFCMVHKFDTPVISFRDGIIHKRSFFKALIKLPDDIIKMHVSLDVFEKIFFF